MYLYIVLVVSFLTFTYGEEAAIDENSILPKAEIFASSLVNDKLVELKGVKLVSVLKKSLEKIDTGNSNNLSVQISFVLEVGETFCDKNESFIDSCPLDITKPHRICQLNILYSNEAFVLPDEEEVLCNILEVVDEPLSTEKAVCLGCLHDVEIENPEIRSLLENTLLKVEGLTDRYITKILKAQSQVVAGIKYYIEFIAAVPHCVPDEEKESQFHCVVSEDSKHEHCNIEIVERKWLGSTEVIDVNCTPFNSSLMQETSFEIVSMEPPKADIDAETTIQPSLNENDIIDQLLEFGFINEDINEDELKIVDSNSEELDDETVYHFHLIDVTDELCDLDVHVDCHGNKSSVTNCTQGWSKGDIVDIDTNDDTVQEFLDFARHYVTNDHNHTGKLDFHAVQSAQKQAVSGTLFHFHLKYLQDCIDGDCNPGPKKEIDCKVKVLFQPWNKHKQILGSSCSDYSENKVRRKRSLGSHKPVKSLQAIQHLANVALSHLVSQAGYSNQIKLKKVLKAEYQVVAGLLYHLVVEIDTRNCSSDIQANGIHCQPSEVCKFSILEQAWKKLTQVTHFSCRQRLTMNRHGSKFGKYITMQYFTDIFMPRYNKTYETKAELRRRFSIFKRNMFIADDLQRTERGTARYGPTFFADLTVDEFRRHYLGVNVSLKTNSTFMKVAEHYASFGDLPTSFDWRDQNVVTPVKNQGMCGSCWAFSVVGNIESLNAIKTGKLYSLSEQELVDCDKLDEGCNGGYPTNAYEVIHNIGGLETESDYPYDGRDETCAFNVSEVVVEVMGAVNISSNETEMAEYLIANGPISVALNANAMQFYFGGVSHPLRFLCNPDGVDHAVLIVGYGVHTSRILKRQLPYWIIKNSWGTFWGEKGYYRLYRGDGSCGINTMATSAIL